MAKKLFYHRFMDWILHPGSQQRGFVPDVHVILRTYNLHQHMTRYFMGGDFLASIPWKCLVTRTVRELDLDSMKAELTLKADSQRFLRVHYYISLSTVPNS